MKTPRRRGQIPQVGKVCLALGGTELLNITLAVQALLHFEAREKSVTKKPSMRAARFLFPPLQESDDHSVVFNGGRHWVKGQVT